MDSKWRNLRHDYITCTTGGKFVMKLVFWSVWAGAAGVMAMTGGAGVGMAMETGGWGIMGCWCWGMTGPMAMARAGRLGTGGEGNWLKISTFIAGRPLWNKGRRFMNGSELGLCDNQYNIDICDWHMADIRLDIVLGVWILQSCVLWWF